MRVGQREAFIELVRIPDCRAAKRPTANGNQDLLSGRNCRSPTLHGGLRTVLEDN